MDSSTSPPLWSKEIDLVGWTNYKWVQNINSHCSTGGFVFDMVGGSVLWSAKKQPMVALLMIEAKYMATSNATKEVIWLWVLLKDLGYSQPNATVIHADNQGCIVLAQNPVTHSQAKHINIQHHFLCECIEMKEIDLHYCSTKDILTNIFTKALLYEMFEKFYNMLGVMRR